MYEDFFECIDGVDNGIDRYPKDIKANYRSGGTSLGNRVNNLNSRWWDPTPYDSQKRFYQAMDLCEEEYLNNLQKNFVNSFVSKKFVLDAIENRFKIDESGEILYLERFCSWKKSLFLVE